jgi:hypothetical protein
MWEIINTLKKKKNGATCSGRAWVKKTVDLTRKKCCDPGHHFSGHFYFTLTMALTRVAAL